MRIKYERSRGVAGLQLAVTIDPDALPTEEAEELRELDRSWIG